jgi:hypothetical protein
LPDSTRAFAGACFAFLESDLAGFFEARSARERALRLGRVGLAAELALMIVSL